MKFSQWSSRIHQESQGDTQTRRITRSLQVPLVKRSSVASKRRSRHWQDPNSPGQISPQNGWVGRKVGGPVTSYKWSYNPAVKLRGCIFELKPFKPFITRLTLLRGRNLTMFINHLHPLGWSSKYQFSPWPPNFFKSPSLLGCPRKLVNGW